MSIGFREIAGMLDHSLLAPTLTERELEEGCAEAVEFAVASVCILPFDLPSCVRRLERSGVRPSTTIGFPHGAVSTESKLFEARWALDAGAQELDMVVNISRTRSGDFGVVADEIERMTRETHGRGAKIKVIFENCYLNQAQKIRLCELCGQAGADWIKTSTGFGSGGATLEDVALMRRHAPPEVAVKASGGIRDLDTVLAARQLGATRCGTSRTRAILEEARRRFDSA